MWVKTEEGSQCGVAYAYQRVFTYKPTSSGKLFASLVQINQRSPN